MLTLLKFADEATVVETVKRSGVSFAADAAALGRLKQGGASDAVLQAVREAAKPAKPTGKLVTFQELLTMVRLGLPEPVILKAIANSPTLFVLGADQQQQLKQAGATPAIMAAIKARQPAGVPTDGEPAGNVTDVAIILDCSASMSEPTSDGEPKMAAAKRVVTDLIRKIPDDLRVAFIVYGHDKQLACQAVKVVRPLSEWDAQDKAELTGFVAGLQPTGNTPIALALRTAGAELAKAEEGCGVVLISDGKENCKGDPAAEAAKLAQNPKLTFGVNVVGFGVTEEEQEALSKIGKLYSASNARELEEALVKLVPQRPDPGSFFHDAPAVAAGEYKGNLPTWTAHYYRVAVRKGQEMRAVFQVQKPAYKIMEIQNHQSYSVTIYNEDLATVKREVAEVSGDPVTPTALRAIWTAEADGVAYVAVASQMCSYGILEDQDVPKLDPSSYALRIRFTPEVSTAGRLGQTTAPLVKAKPGGSFNSAGKLTVPALAVTDLGVDQSVYYRLSANKGDVLKVDVAVQKPNFKNDYPQNRASYMLRLYDEDQMQVAQKELVVGGDPVDAHSTSVSVPVGLTGDVYISLSCLATGGDHGRPFGSLKPGHVAIRVTTPLAGGAAGGAPRSSDPFAGAEAGDR